jgi:antirestriction protein ArdC
MENKTKRKSGKTKPDVYRIVTDRIIKLLDEGTVPWKKPWVGGSAGMPRNLISNKPYQGINVWLTAAQGYGSPYWLTFKQARTLGGSVRKGEKGTPIVFWRILEKEEVKDGVARVRKVFFLRYSNVFNLDQTEDVKVPKGRIIQTDPEEVGGHLDFEANRQACEDADKLFEDYTTRESISVTYGGSKAGYLPPNDSIRLPNQEDFDSAESFHAVRFHEATHSTGAKTRCNRDGVADFDFFGSHQYSEEELVAEFGSTFLCSIVGIDRDETIENAAAYIKHWRAKLDKDPKIVVQAAQKAQKATTFILGDANTNTEPVEEEAAAA